MPGADCDFSIPFAPASIASLAEWARQTGFYNAGTDSFSGDRMGRLDVSGDDILKRDVMVFSALIDRGILFVVVPSGGYTRDSYSMITRSAAWLIGKVASLPPR